MISINSASKKQRDLGQYQPIDGWICTNLATGCHDAHHFVERDPIHALYVGIRRYRARQVYWRTVATFRSEYHFGPLCRVSANIVVGLCLFEKTAKACPDGTWSAWRIICYGTASRIIRHGGRSYKSIFVNIIWKFAGGCGVQADTGRESSHLGGSDNLRIKVNPFNLKSNTIWVSSTYEFLTH